METEIFVHLPPHCMPRTQKNVWRIVDAQEIFVDCMNLKRKQFTFELVIFFFELGRFYTYNL